MENLDRYDKVEHADGSITLTPKKTDLDWEPSTGEWYFSMDTTGDVIDHMRYSPDHVAHHNAFKTKEQAEKASKLQRISNAIIRACLLVDPEFVPDWGKARDKHRAYFDTTSNSWLPHTSRAHFVGIAHVSTREKAEQVCALLTKWGVSP